MTRMGLSVEVGRLGQIVRGEAGIVLDALQCAQEAALAAGASQLAVNLERIP